MGVDSIDDLRIILSGQSREYPRFLGEDWRGRPGIASHYGWLMAPGNRKIKIAGEDQLQGWALGRREAPAGVTPMIIVIDREEYEVPNDVDMTPQELRCLGPVAPDRELWEILARPCATRRLSGTSIFSMPEGMRRRFFTSPSYINNSGCGLCIH